VSTEWIVLVCSVICGYGYYKKGVYMQVIGATARRYFLGRNTVSHENAYIPKNKPTKNALQITEI